jgi:hypothetical protein
MRRKVVLPNNAQYLAKSAYFYYHEEVDENGIQKDDASSGGTHAVSLIIPSVKTHKVKIINSNHQKTMNEPPRKYTEISENQLGYVGGIFFVRTNHPSTESNKARRRKANQWVNIQKYACSSFSVQLQIELR